MDEGEELKGQLYNVAGELYEDQFALIVIGETELCDGNCVQVNAAGAAIIPDGCTPNMLTTAIFELMLQEPNVADIIKNAVLRFDAHNTPNPICLN